VKSGYISGRLEEDGSWETHRKNEGFSMLMDNLKVKNEEAVLKYLEEIPEEDIEKFKQDMWWIHEHKWSGLQEDAVDGKHSGQDSKDRERHWQEVEAGLKVFMF